MAIIKAVASGPILFTASNGDQLSIPASVLRFDDSTGILQIPAPFVAATDWLKHLVTTGFIQPEPPRATPGPSTTPVLTLTALSPGEWGNNITATITYDSDPATYKIAVAASVSIELTTSTMASILGTETLVPARTTPVLVRAGTLDTSAKPINTAPVALSTGPLAIKNYNGDNSTVFQLDPRKVPSGTSIMVSITGANSTNDRFTLTLTWSATSASVSISVPPDSTVRAARQAALTSTIGYLVDVVYNGGKPKAGTFSLTGGVEGTRAHFLTQAVL
jgi:hypothetical protein